VPRLLVALAALTFAAGPGALAAPAASASPPADRSGIPDKYKWKLADLYPSDQAWAEAKEAFGARLTGFSRHEGHLGESAKALADALSELGSIRNELQRITNYAMLRSDEDTRQPKPRAMKAEADQLSTRTDAATAWVAPEIVALPADRIHQFVTQDPRLREWSFFLDDVLRYKPHTLSAAEARIFAKTGDLARTGEEAYSVLINADLPFPTVKLSTGESIRLDQSGYERARTTGSPADREKVFRAFFGALKGYERTFGTTLFSNVRAHVVDAEIHRFGSPLEKALFADDIPTSVYTELVKDVNANLPTLHRYLALRKRALGLKELHYEDLYAPLVKRVERRFTIDQGIAMTLDAVAPLGEAYQQRLAHGFETGWTDFLPATGKQAGAYSTAVWGVHPYQLLNFNGQWRDVSTLAHESGHSMHYLLANEHQPFPTSDYSTFVAEVASTLNENFLFRRSLAEAKDDRDRLSILGERLEALRTVLFRQSMFAEFELAIHEHAQKGEALTGERMSELYLELVRRYYGHDQGVCKVADLYGVEWTFIRHFYFNFYVYQYATSVIASTAIAKAIREDEAQGRTEVRDRYLAMLAAGGSKYPIQLLREAGVDMTTPAPFTAAMEEMNGVMDQIEAILAKGGGKAAATR
jgi:oligoendopeptidase F